MSQKGLFYFYLITNKNGVTQILSKNKKLRGESCFKYSFVSIYIIHNEESFRWLKHTIHHFIRDSYEFTVNSVLFSIISET